MYHSALEQSILHICWNSTELSDCVQYTGLAAYIHIMHTHRQPYPLNQDDIPWDPLTQHNISSFFLTETAPQQWFIFKPVVKDVIIAVRGKQMP